jgi:hypothetical protein
MDKWKAALDGSTHTSEIEAEKNPADDGISGTPAFSSCRATPPGLLHQRRAELRQVRKLIERALAEAR